MRPPVALAAELRRILGVVLDPGQSAETESLTGSGDGDIGQACLGQVDFCRDGLPIVGEVLSEAPTPMRGFLVLEDDEDGDR